MTLVDAFLLALFIGVFVACGLWVVVFQPSKLRTWLVGSVLGAMALMCLCLRTEVSLRDTIVTVAWAPFFAGAVVFGAWLRGLPLEVQLAQREADERERLRLRGKPFDFGGK